MAWFHRRQRPPCGEVFLELPIVRRCGLCGRGIKSVWRIRMRADFTAGDAVGFRQDAHSCGWPE